MRAPHQMYLPVSLVHFTATKAVAQVQEKCLE